MGTSTKTLQIGQQGIYYWNLGTSSWYQIGTSLKEVQIKGYKFEPRRIFLTLRNQIETSWDKGICF